MSKKDNLEKGVKFGQGQDPTKGGRKKKIYTILKEMGYSKDDVRSCFGELLWYTEKDLKEVVSDSTKPIITQITAKALLESKGNGDIHKIREILEQSIGKPNQTVDVNTTIGANKDVDTEDFINFQKSKDK